MLNQGSISVEQAAPSLSFRAQTIAAYSALVIQWVGWAQLGSSAEVTCNCDLPHGDRPENPQVSLCSLESSNLSFFAAWRLTSANMCARAYQADLHCAF